MLQPQNRLMIFGMLIRLEYITDIETDFVGQKETIVWY